jgi:hypothetical protein
MADSTCRFYVRRKMMLSGIFLEKYFYFVININSLIDLAV